MHAIGVECQFSSVRTGDKWTHTCALCTRSVVTSRESAKRKCIATPSGYWATLDCQLRGEQTREVECRLCGNRGKIAEVFECREFGECTLRRTGHKINSCLGCPARIPVHDADC
jgi:hypothetical protein